MFSYGDHRDTQRRYMHRAAPHRAEGFESRIFAEGERHDPAEGWTHDPAHAVELGKAKASKAKPPAEIYNDFQNMAVESAHLTPRAPVQPSAEPVPDAEDESEAGEDEIIPFEAQLAALKRPALFKLAQELNVPFETGWTAAELRRAIITSRG